MNIGYEIKLKGKKYKDFLILCNVLKNNLFIDYFTTTEWRRLSSVLGFIDVLRYYDSMINKKIFIRKEHPNGDIHIEIISIFYIGKIEYLVQFYIPFNQYDKIFNFLDNDIKLLN